MPRGPYFGGGPKRDTNRMIVALADFTDLGELPPEAALVFSQLLLNFAGKAGRKEAQRLLDAFLDAADVPLARPVQ